MFTTRSRTSIGRPFGADFDAQLSRRSLLARTVHTIGKLSIWGACPTLFLFRRTTAAQVAVDDPRIRTEKLEIGAQWGKLECYLVRPNLDAAPLPAVIVAHDRLGLTPHFKDVARRFALEGFIALAPDYASRFGGTPSEPGPALEVVGMTNSPDMTKDTGLVLQWLEEIGRSQNVGAAGFGLGGTAMGFAAARLADLKAVAVYYGHPTPLADIGHLKAPLLLNLAGKDQFVDPEIPACVDALKKASAKELYTYEGTVRGFDDDSMPAHYSADAAMLAWSRTITFLKKSLI